MGKRFQRGSRPAEHDIIRRALGFDVDAELELCKRLAANGGPVKVKSVFDGARAARLFQALLSTGRFQEMDEHWKVSIQIGIDRGTLAPPEWN